MLVVLTRVFIWLQFGVVTDFSGQMITFDGHWHAVCSSRMNPGFNCNWQMSDSVYGIVWASGFLMSTLWTVPNGCGGVMVWTSLSYGQWT
jgi:hypothetical protein